MMKECLDINKTGIELQMNLRSSKCVVMQFPVLVNEPTSISISFHKVFFHIRGIQIQV